MTWRTLLQNENEILVSPWIGGRVLRLGSRTWFIEGPLPCEHGWAQFSINGRNAKFKDFVEIIQPWYSLKHKVTGYLVGDRLVTSDARVDPDPKNIVDHSERVHLIDPGLDRFALVSAGRVSEDSPLVFIQQEMPLGPESDVCSFFLDGKTSLDAVKGVSPALDAAFRMEIWQRSEAIRRRAELEERLRKEAEVRALETRRREIAERLGDGVGRREMAVVDFEAAAKAALAIGGAEYLDHRNSTNRGEIVVRFRLHGRRFECACNKKTLQIIDAGICLTAHDDPDFETGTKGDQFFSLESLPSVILEAEREGKLVVFRHVD